MTFGAVSLICVKYLPQMMEMLLLNSIRKIIEIINLKDQKGQGHMGGKVIRNQGHLVAERDQESDREKDQRTGKGQKINTTNLIDHPAEGVVLCLLVDIQNIATQHIPSELHITHNILIKMATKMGDKIDTKGQGRRQPLRQLRKGQGQRVSTPEGTSLIGKRVQHRLQHLQGHIPSKGWKWRT